MKYSVLADFIGITETDRRFVIFTDNIKNLSYIRKAEEIVSDGLFCMLAGYEYQLFTDFYILEDTDGRYERLWEKLKGAGCEDIEFEAGKLEFSPIFDVFKPFFAENKLNFEKIKAIVFGEIPKEKPNLKPDTGIMKKTEQLFEKLKGNPRFSKIYDRKTEILRQMEKNCEFLNTIVRTLLSDSAKTEWLASQISYHDEWIIASAFPIITDIPALKECIREGVFSEIIFESIYERESVKKERQEKFKLLAILSHLLTEKTETFNKALEDSHILSFLKVNLYREKYWFKGERMLQFISLFAFYRILSGWKPEKAGKEFFLHLKGYEASKYRMDLLVQKLQS